MNVFTTAALALLLTLAGCGETGAKSKNSDSSTLDGGGTTETTDTNKSIEIIETETGDSNETVTGNTNGTGGTNDTNETVTSSDLNDSSNLEEDGTTESSYLSIIDDNLDTHDSVIWQIADGWANGSPFYNGWCAGQIGFGSSRMQLTLAQNPCSGMTHASGEYRTQDVYRYGRYTARFKASNVNGTISSFFTYTGPYEGTQHDEIDVEIFGKDPTTMQVNYWRNGVEHPTLIDLGFDASQEFHTYAFIWTASAITWYVDGVEVHSEDGSRGALPETAGKIMMNLWACDGSSTALNAWCGTYTDGTAATAVYEHVSFEALP